MSNSYYTHGAFPSTGSAATSASMRAELDLITVGFDKLPTLASHANEFVVVNSLGTAMTTTSVLPTATVTDNTFTIQDDGDNTKKFQFQASGITAGATRIFTVPDADAILVGTATTQTLTNKTLTTPTLTNPTVTNYVETPYSANSSTAITIALTNGTVQIITLTGNATITMPTATAGKSFIIMLKQDATGSRSVTWSTVKYPGGTAPTITATASKQDIFSFFADGTNWYGTTIGLNYTP